MNNRKKIKQIEEILLQAGQHSAGDITVPAGWKRQVMESVWTVGPFRQIAEKANGILFDRILWRVALTAVVLAVIAVIFGVNEYLQFESSLIQMAVENPADLSAIAMNL
jgi:hypothetical protein